MPCGVGPVFGLGQTMKCCYDCHWMTQCTSWAQYLQTRQPM
jgi:hypothetical protein